MTNAKAEAPKQAAKAAEGKNPNGRPTKYKPEYAEQARKLCEEGATNPDLAAAFGVSLESVRKWRLKHTEFAVAIRVGKRKCDKGIERSLYERAKGYSHPEEKLFQHGGMVIRAETTRHYPPDATSSIFWLKNRDPEHWRDKHEVGGEVVVTLAQALKELVGAGDA